MESMSIADDLGSLLFGFILGFIDHFIADILFSFSMAALSSWAEASKASFSLFQLGHFQFHFSAVARDLAILLSRSFNSFQDRTPGEFFQDEQYDQEGQNVQTIRPKCGNKRSMANVY